MTESTKEEEEKSMISISLGSEFLSLITTQDDGWSRSDSCVTKASSFINTSFPDGNSSCYHLHLTYKSEDGNNDNDATDHGDIRNDIHQLWMEKKELEKALSEMKQREAWTRPPLMRKQQLNERSNFSTILPKQRKWDAGTCDRFQLRPIRVKTNDSILNEIATRREKMRLEREYTADKSTSDRAVSDTDKKEIEKHTKSIRSPPYCGKASKERRQSDASGRRRPVPTPPRPAMKAHDTVPRSSGLIMNAMMWVSQSSWWDPSKSASATQIRIPPPNRRI